MNTTKLIFLSLTFFLVKFSFAQSNDSLLIHQLVKEIEAMQTKQDGRDFYAGSFPSFRECAGAPHNYQPDNNVFFTAISAFTLKNMLPYLDEENKSIIQQTVDKAIKIYPYYQNRYGYPFYNFWPTHKPIMPHTYYFKYLKSVFGQGEDSDDSVMILLSTDNNDSASAELKKQLIRTSNLSRKKIVSTYKKYRSIPGYSTWLGFRMTPDFDFAVQCNILYFLYDKKLPLVKQDSATVYLLQQMIANREYMKAPVYLSPYYVHSSILLYHIARLMGRFSIPELEPYKPQLIADIHKQLNECHNIMDQVILRTALLRLGSEAPALGLANLNEFENSNQNQFVFFQARAAFSYPTPFKQVFLHWSYINYHFYCPAYNKILLLEYLVEKSKKD
ncbi:MAG: hypothetical protein ACTHJ5_10200 [Ilyomonas sp.]